MWRLPDMRRRLIAHCIDERHPYRERFERHRPLLEEVLSSEFPEAALDEGLRARGTSLRCVARETPPVLGSFFS